MGRTAILGGVFLILGACALAFETLWFHQARLAFGQSVWASSLVLSAFMAGMGLGNFACARNGDRVRNALRLYAGLELAVAVSRVALVYVLPELGRVFAPLAEPLAGQPALLNLLRLATALLLLLMPAAAMGVTLPLLARAVSAWDTNFGRVLGFLYGANTLGAVLGARDRDAAARAPGDPGQCAVRRSAEPRRGGRRAPARAQRALPRHGRRRDRAAAARTRRHALAGRRFHVGAAALGAGGGLAALPVAVPQRHAAGVRGGARARACRYRGRWTVGVNKPHLRYVAAWGVWMDWDGRRWEREETLKAFDLARAGCRSVGHGLDDAKLRTRTLSAGTRAAVENLARSDRAHAATPDQWDGDPCMLNTPEGIVDLKTATVLPHDPLAYHTKMAAVAPGGTCPLWIDFLKRITAGDDDLLSYLQRSAGYTLTGSTCEHAMQFGYGTGANGKSTYLKTLSGIMGDYAVVAPIETFTATAGDRHPTDLAMLRGARLVTAQETEQGRRARAELDGCPRP